MMNEVVMKLNNMENKTAEKKPSCWNCRSTEHYIRDCKQPCGLCKENGHKHYYECKLYKITKPSNQQELMLIEEASMSEKRNASVIIADDNTNLRMSRSGRNYETPVKKRMIFVAEPGSAKAEDTKAPKPIDSRKTVQSGPKHPQLPPNEDVIYASANENKKVTEIVDNILADPVIKIYVQDLATISPMARSKIKTNITKSQVKRSATRPDNSATTVVLGETNVNLPKGKSEPRAYGTVNGVKQEIILDGGCTSYIISLNVARRLGIRDVEAYDHSVMFVDGRARTPNGLAKNIRLQVGDSKTVLVDAMCFDVGDKYGFIVGREGLHTLEIGTDWSTHYWYVKNNNTTLPLEVHYTSNEQRVGILTPTKNILLKTISTSFLIMTLKKILPTKTTL